MVRPLAAAEAMIGDLSPEDVEGGFDETGRAVGKVARAATFDHRRPVTGGGLRLGAILGR